MTVGVRERFGPEQRQGAFGERVIDLLAASAGLVTAAWDIDVRGIDRTIGYPGDSTTSRQPHIEVQVKTWSRPHSVGDDWRYAMKVPHFNDIAGKFNVPRFLFLVMVPDDEQRWCTVGPDSINILHSSYWACFEADEPHTIGVSHTVSVPKANLLTRQTLLGLVRDPWNWKLVTA